MEITVGSEKQIKWAKSIQSSQQGSEKAKSIDYALEMIAQSDFDEDTKNKASEGVKNAAKTAKYWIDNFDHRALLAVAEDFVNGEMTVATKEVGAALLFEEAQKASA